MHAATTIRHRSTSAWPAITAPRATARRGIRQGQALAENARVGFVFHFEALPPRRRAPPPGCRTARLDLARHDGLPAFGHRDVLDDDPVAAPFRKWPNLGHFILRHRSI